MSPIAYSLLAVDDPTTSDCICLPSIEQELNHPFFPEIIDKINQPKETFKSIFCLLERNKHSCHQFQFKYPLGNERHAQIFAKILQIKAQEAHRFVPVITSCKFVSPSHLGFIRKITVKGKGSIVEEHVLIDQDSNAVIFVEELIETKKGVMLGCFAALNDIIEEDGQWYFVGTYLYGSKPTDNEILERKESFRETYENMLYFVENEDVDKIYNQLLWRPDSL